MRRWTGVLVSTVGLAAFGCSDGQPAWCAELRSLGDLDDLSAAIVATDGEAATAELDRFEDVAGSAPTAVRSDMETIATTLRQVVDIAMAGDAADADELELRRDAANQQLAGMTSHLAAVSTWAEKECGIRLD